MHYNSTTIIVQGFFGGGENLVCGKKFTLLYYLLILSIFLFWINCILIICTYWIKRKSIIQTEMTNEYQICIAY